MSDRTLKEAISIEMKSTYHKRALYVLADAVSCQNMATEMEVNGSELLVFFDGSIFRLDLEYNEGSEDRLADLECRVRYVADKKEEDHRLEKVWASALAKLSVEEREVLGLMGL